MHKEDIKPSINWCVDYIPEDHILCKRCYFFEICPLDYTCKSLVRCIDHENLDNDDTN